MSNTMVKRKHFHKIFRLNCANNVIILNMWLHIAKSALQNWYSNHLALPIEERLTVKTFKNKYIRSQTDNTLLQMSS